MSKLNKIQNEIKQLEGGKFQQLCDTYLFKKRNWDNIMRSGSMDGTDKTTKGIPDTYFFDQETQRYVLVMYGTAKDSTAKLKKDVKDAIDKSQLDKKIDIQEIICCHTSSNVDVQTDKELKKLAEPIKLTLIGIDSLSYDLKQFNYQSIASEYLGISKTTEQVWNIDQFISIHDISKTNAPLTTSFIDVGKINDLLFDYLNSHQILLLTGIPGVGKTRRAIELLKKLSSDNNIICVKSNNMPVYQDIKDSLDMNRLNYLFLDDANTITNLDAITNLLAIEEYSSRLKIIMTVRKYAFNEIKEQLNSFSTKIYNIPTMDNNEIEKLIKSINTELSDVYLKDIVKSSKKNPRMAVLVTELMQNQKGVVPADISEIIESYYGQIVQDNALTLNEKKALFVVGFKKKINIMDNNSFKDLLSFLEIDFENFENALYKLHDKELCDIFQDKAVKVNDQSLTDFIIIDLIGKKKKLKIRDLFDSLYPRYSEEIVEMFSLVESYVISEDWRKYFTNELKYIYKELISEPEKENFLIQYGAIIPTEAEAYVYQQIQQVDEVKFQASKKTFDEAKRKKEIKDPIIKILCSLSNCKKYDDAARLLIEYFRKRQDKVYEIFSAIMTSFDIELDSTKFLENRFSIVNAFLDQKNLDKLTSLLMVNVSKEFLNFSGEKLIAEGKDVSITSYSLRDGEYLIELHKKVFNMLVNAYERGYKETNDCIDELLFNYPVYKEVKNGFSKTIKSDLNCIENLFFNSLENMDLRKEAIVFKLKDDVKRSEIDSQVFPKYELSVNQEVYNVFSRVEHEYITEKDDDFDAIHNLRIENLKNIFEKYSGVLPNVNVFNILSEYQTDDLLNKPTIEESVFLLYSEVSVKQRERILSTLLNSDFALTLYHPNNFMERLPFEKSKQVLESSEKKIDEKWYLSNLLCCEELNEDRVQELATFLKKVANSRIINTFNIFCFGKYLSSKNVILDILWQKYENNELSVEFFLPNYISKDSIKILMNTIGKQKIKELYLENMSIKSIDRSSTIFNELIKKEDVGFVYQFLVEIEKDEHSLHSVNYWYLHLKNLWNMSNIEESIEMYLDYLIQENHVIFIGVDSCLETIFKENIVRSSLFIKNKIINTEDEKVLVDLYNLSVEIFSKDILLELFKLLRDKEINTQVFEQIRLVGFTSTWTGSQVPLIDQDIDFLNKLLSVFEGVEYIPYSEIIEKHKDHLEQEKENVLLSEYLE
ncbi:hypothetical protein [Tetragenococcus halophilus]|uniref:nSTAND3 domain-containing NTPase n=1 Tax=Tetragenococcus halophilus TaxID=51669 RepID=UPI000CC6E3E7|nr:hypothetical protein [Tetragenococcus halophilus]MCO8289988.1 hypothetical protein [Tetragenococcus halophilus]GBD62426.1 hypothetical protein TEH11_2109 [Tetragenococcus halophilus subsp. halophilus]